MERVKCSVCKDLWACGPDGKCFGCFERENPNKCATCSRTMTDAGFFCGACESVGLDRWKFEWQEHVSYERDRVPKPEDGCFQCHGMDKHRCFCARKQYEKAWIQNAAAGCDLCIGPTLEMGDGSRVCLHHYDPTKASW